MRSGACSTPLCGEERTGRRAPRCTYNRRMPSLVSPFRALRPRPDRAADVIAPPYDVVSSDEARALAAGRPASFLHISRPEIDLPPATSPYADETYARGAANLARLVADGVLTRD